MRGRTPRKKAMRWRNEINTSGLPFGVLMWSFEGVGSSSKVIVNGVYSGPRRDYLSFCVYSGNKLLTIFSIRKEISHGLCSTVGRGTT